jgi:large repetitive protein
VTATDSKNSSLTGSQAYLLTVVAPTITLTPTTLPSPRIEVAYSERLSARGGMTQYRALPTGLTLNSTTGLILGTATAAGTFNFTVTAKDSDSFTAAQAYSFTVAAPTIALTRTMLPSPTIEVAYAQTLSASGGIAPYTYSISTGALPAGLTLSSTTGAISGTATATGTFNFTVTAKESNSFTAAQAYSFTVARQASQTTVSASPSVANPVQTVTLTAVVSATVSGTSIVTSGNVTFLDNGTQMGTATLSGGTAGVAQLTTSLPAGTTAVITATYAGDNNFVESMSNNIASVVVSLFDFAFTNTGTAAYTAAPGTAATYNFDVTPVYGSYTGPVTFSVTGLPTGAPASFTRAR